MIQNSISKVKNNPIATIVGGVATFYILTKKYPTANIVTNKYMFVGSIVLGGLVGAMLSSEFKKSNF
jgi:uncharacterized membrane protein AbrB (regulator of aidB expression)